MYKVLIVDDESWVVESLKDLIEWDRFGFEVAGQAYNGSDALEAIRELRPEVVFTDIRMPGMNGLELIQRGKLLPFPVQFVVVSGYAEFAYAQKALAHGAVAYCLKPFDEVEISGVLKKISATLGPSRPALESLLVHLLEDSGADQQERLQAEMKLYGYQDWESERLAAVVAVGSGTLLCESKEPVAKLRIGTLKTAYLLSGKQIDSMREEWTGGLPAGISGIGISEAITEMASVKSAIAMADELANQSFITSRPGIYDAAMLKQFRKPELNLRMSEMSEAIRDKDRQALANVFGRIEMLFRDGALSIRDAFQVYNMTSALLFKLGQAETIFFSYDQMAQSYPDVFAMLDDIQQLAYRYLGESDLPAIETKNQTFKAILQYVTQNYRQEISLQNLSDQFFMNPSYISQLFKKRSRGDADRLLVAASCGICMRPAGEG